MQKIHATIQAYGITEDHLIAALQHAIDRIKSGSPACMYASSNEGYRAVVGEELHVFTTQECCTLHTAMEETVNRISQSPEGYEDEESEEADREILAKIELAAGR